MPDSAPITGTGISVVTDKSWSAKVILQLLNSDLDIIKLENDVWSSSEELQATPVPVDGTSVTSITWNNGKHVSRLLYFRYLT